MRAHTHDAKHTILKERAAIAPRQLSRALNAISSTGSGVDTGYTSTTANYFALACFDFEVHRRNRVCVTEQFRNQNQQELTNEFQVSTSS